MMARLIFLVLLLGIVGVSLAAYNDRRRGAGLTTPTNLFPGWLSEPARWGSWSSWSGCSQNCGSGYQTRNRRCIKPRNAIGDCRGRKAQRQSCNGEQCAVDGRWSEWGDYSECVGDCRSGVKIRYRTCTDPAPSGGGKHCRGRDSSTKSCSTGIQCAVNGAWGAWGSYGVCSATCAYGVKIRQRFCDYPKPQYGGNLCLGSSSETQQCKDLDCPVNGRWSAWGSYTACSATCGNGIQIRYRNCDSPLPQYGGDLCLGGDNEARECKNADCKVNGGWSAWGSYDICSATCGYGVQRRYRNCDYPLPQYGGDFCLGNDNDAQECKDADCPAEGGWSGWGEFGECSVTCGRGEKARYRRCDSPAPLNGGGDCAGSEIHTKACTTKQCPVDGGWTYWTYWSDCIGICKFGKRKRSRACTHPTPAYRGQVCPGNKVETERCKLRKCY